MSECQEQIYFLHPVTRSDITRLQRWLDADSSKRNMPPELWLTGNGELCFRYDGANETVCFVRLDRDGRFIRMHYLFAPEGEISKRKIAKAILTTIPLIVQFAKKKQATGLTYDSVSPSLIAFVEKAFGFKPTGNDNYVLEFEVTTCADS